VLFFRRACIEPQPENQVLCRGMIWKPDRFVLLAALAAKDQEI
jgi:hypothetical protein